MRARTLDIVGHRQVRNYTCGYASSLTVLRHFRPEIRARELYDRLGTGRDGTRQGAIIRELRRAGLSANARYDFDFQRLQTAVDRGKLIIAYYYPAEHWVVLYGYGREPERVFVADSRAGEQCEHPWADYGPKLRGFGIIIADREARPASASEAAAELAPAQAVQASEVSRPRTPILLPPSSLVESRRPGPPGAAPRPTSPGSSTRAVSPGAAQRGASSDEREQLAFDF